MIRILSIDGGGLRGIIPASVLVYLQKHLDMPMGKHIGEYFDLITGTSTGGIIALALAKRPPVPVEEILELYTVRGNEIFSRGFLEYFPWMFRRKYNHKPLESLLIEYLGEEPLAACAIRVMVPARDLLERKTIWFKSWKNGTAIPIWEVARATSAAHTYFCAHKGQVDGGVSVNNPSACAAAEARVIWPNEEVMVVSLGTGVSTSSLGRLSCEGYGKWAPHLIGEFMDGSADAVDYQMDKDPGIDYRRFQMKLDWSSDKMDDCSRKQVESLLRETELRILINQKDSLDQLVKDLRSDM